MFSRRGFSYMASAVVLAVNVEQTLQQCVGVLMCC